MKIKRQREESKLHDLFQSIGIDLSKENEASAEELVKLCSDLKASDPDTIIKLARLLNLKVTETMTPEDICKLLIKEKKHRIDNESLWKLQAVYINKYKAFAKEKGWTEEQFMSGELSVKELIREDFNEDSVEEALVTNFPLTPDAQGGLKRAFLQALQFYIGSGYEPINEYLRLQRLKDKLPEERVIFGKTSASVIKKTISDLQSIEWPKTTHSNTIVLRAMSAISGNEKTWSCDCGKKFMSEEYYVRHQKVWQEQKHEAQSETLFELLHKSKPGDKLIDEGFLSTTVSFQMAWSWLTTSCCILIIHIPERTSYINVNFTMDSDIKEYEVLFPPNRRFIYLDRFGPLVELKMLLN